MRLFGKDLTAYTLLEQQADVAFRAATAFHALSKDFGGLAEYVSQVDEIEHEGDKLTQQLARKIDSSSGMPIGRRDLHSLSSQLDDVTDHIEFGHRANRALPAERAAAGILSRSRRCWCRLRAPSEK